MSLRLLCTLQPCTQQIFCSQFLHHAVNVRVDVLLADAIHTRRQYSLILKYRSPSIHIAYKSTQLVLVIDLNICSYLQ